MNKNKGIVYFFFRLLLLKDFWCIFVGTIIASMLAPKVYQTKENIEITSKIIIWIMIMTLGWTITIWPASKISSLLQNLIKNLYKKYLL